MAGRQNCLCSSQTLLSLSLRLLRSSPKGGFDAAGWNRKKRPRPGNGPPRSAHAQWPRLKMRRPQKESKVREREREPWRQQHTHTHTHTYWSPFPGVVIWQCWREGGSLGGGEGEAEAAYPGGHMTAKLEPRGSCRRLRGRRAFGAVGE